MPSSEHLPLRVDKVGEDEVKIQEGLGESIVIDLKTAKQRLENLKKKKSDFASEEMWRKQVAVTREAIALLGGEDKSTIAKIAGKVKEMLRGKK